MGVESQSWLRSYEDFVANCWVLHENFLHEWHKRKVIFGNYVYGRVFIFYTSNSIKHYIGYRPVSISWKSKQFIPKAKTNFWRSTAHLYNTMLIRCWPTISSQFDIGGQHLTNISPTFLTSKSSANGTNMLANKLLTNRLAPFAHAFGLSSSSIYPITQPGLIFTGFLKENGLLSNNRSIV